MCEDIIVVNQKIVLAILKNNFDTPVAVACNGRKGLDMLKREHFDIVLMDVMVRSQCWRRHRPCRDALPARRPPRKREPEQATLLQAQGT